MAISGADGGRSTAVFRGTAEKIAVAIATINSKSLRVWIEAINHRRAVNSLQAKHDRYAAKMNAAISDAEKRRERDEYDSLVSEYLFETDNFEDEIRGLETRYLTRQAHRYLIPVPPAEDGDYWEKSERSGRFRLKLEAIRDLRAAIREEQRQRLEPVKLWIALLTGVIGSLIGLVSVLK